MRIARSLAWSLALCALPAWAQTVPKVLLVGDSWAAQQWEDGVHALVFAANDAERFGVVGATTTESGSTAAEWAAPSGLELIGQALDANPTIDTVQLTIGGNDFLDAWSVTMSPPDAAALRGQIREDLDTVIHHIIDTRPQVEVVISLYDYPNFRDTLNSLAGIAVCRPLHESMGSPTPVQINDAMADFESDLASLTAHPRVRHVSHAGQMQFTYGFPSSGIPPGQLLPPGDATLPSPVTSMRDHGFLGRDCFHLTPSGYDVLVQNLYEDYYHERFDTLLRTPFE